MMAGNKFAAPVVASAAAPSAAGSARGACAARPWQNLEMPFGVGGHGGMSCNQIAGDIVEHCAHHVQYRVEKAACHSMAMFNRDTDCTYIDGVVDASRAEILDAYNEFESNCSMFSTLLASRLMAIGGCGDALRLD